MIKAISPEKTVLATLIVSCIVYYFSRPVAGLGITIPMLVPAISAAFTSLLLDKQTTPQTAYISGSLGTLIGADLANLSKIRNLGISIASIGGAGTFDGIFLSGIMAVILA